MTPNLFKSPSGCRDIAIYSMAGTPFLQKPQFLKGRISKTTALISIKLKVLAFLYKLCKQTKFNANQRFLVKKFWVI